LCGGRAQVSDQAVEDALVGHDADYSAGRGRSHGCVVASSSIATRGSLRSSHRGSAHVVRPSSWSTAGSSAILMTIASRNTALAIANPNIASTRLPLIANAPNTPTITA